MEAAAWVPLTCCGIAFLSAVLPWVNAEVLVLSLPALAHSRTELTLLVLVATVGHMGGKSLIYWGAHRGVGVRDGRLTAMRDRWGARVAAHAAKPFVLVLTSSVIGIPPFYLVTLLAGALKVNFGRYLVAGTCGRLIRFGVLAFAPGAVLHWIG